MDERELDVISFAVTYDYRCPFARNAHEHLVAGVRRGALWDVEFVPFSLTQVHVAEGGTDVWDDPGQAPHLLALEAGVVVRDRFPDAFLDTHLALFAARHDHGRDLGDNDTVRAVLSSCGVDDDAVMDEVRSGWPRQAVRKAHESSVSGHRVFGVPTFIVGPHAVFVRLMTRPDPDGAGSQQVVEHVVSLVGSHPELNEFKHTSIPR
ncbi:MAG TPA: DsbA family protein [Acidimicrobiales bacterium]|nr:DsbA family protein [Acidimicrobiales bacterium]